MTWPITPLTTYVTGISQVKSVDLNAIQAAINVLHAPISIAGCAGAGVGAANSIIGADGSLQTPSGGSGIVPIVLPVGFKVGSIVIIGARVGANNGTYTFFEEDNAAGGATDRGNVSSTSTSREARTIAAIDYTIIADKTYYLKATGGASSSLFVYMMIITPAA